MTEGQHQTSSQENHRAGVVAILGEPNAGKSTLMNRLVGEKLAIVTPKPQTTRSRILGILSLEQAQLLLVDTPGLNEGVKALNRALNDQVDEAVADCDAALLLVDRTRGWRLAHDELVDSLAKRRTPTVIAGTKLDLVNRKTADWPPENLEKAGPEAWAPVVMEISARTGEGVGALIDALVTRLPFSPPLYPEDELSDRPLRFLVAELVREAAFEALSQEVPYELAVEVVEFDESREDLVRIRANLIVTRASQKSIVIGRGGAMIKAIGVQARRAIERLLSNRVHLELWTVVEPKWSKRPNRLKSLGYS
ncbi:GTPase Era [Myxococcota bacterium]|nr:GTPase Era [Myxococcota bacterium]